ncbi:helix-turn-helix domain-containing protein [Streptomyces sp. NPDC001933]|uniref:nSTAND1 domain-containing NTPase n=1 Tax=Streptomyces sp. NPDC001933 TaxID=3364626 RepID=UPI0036B5CD63
MTPKTAIVSATIAAAANRTGVLIEDAEIRFAMGVPFVTGEAPDRRLSGRLSGSAPQISALMLCFAALSRPLNQSMGGAPPARLDPSLRPVGRIGLSPRVFRDRGVMGRREKPLGPAAGPAHEFATALRELRSEAGGPTYSALARRTEYSAATLSRAASGDQLPSLAVALAYAAACGGDPDDWERRWRRAADALSADAEDHDDEASPYRGFARFEPGDENLFFGRERLTDELAVLVREHRIVTVFGPSGSGKSSLLRAGLVPRLRNAAPDHRHEPADNMPVHSGDSMVPAAIRILIPGERPNHHHADALVPAEGSGDTLLIIDQFEEIFTHCHDPNEREAFIAALLAADAPESRLRVVLAVRADFHGHCLNLPGLAAAVGKANLALGPMAPEELRHAITRPAAEHGLVVERALTSRLLEDSRTQAATLPLFSHVLLETWRRRQGRTLTVEAYERAGGLRGAITRAAETAYRQLEPGHTDAARSILLRLITPGEGRSDTRRPTDRAELESAHGDNATIVLETLARVRLITLGRTTVELAHEALVTTWPRLHGWIEQDRENLRFQRWLTEAANAWEGVGREPGVRISPVRLAQLEAQFPRDQQPALTSLESDFLAAGIATHRRALRNRHMTRAMGYLLAAMTTFTAAMTWRQQRLLQANRSRLIR